jgi:hypothetical protein
MLAAYLHNLWLCSLVRSPFRCEVAFSPSFLHKACLYPQLHITGATNCCRERGHVSAVSWQELKWPQLTSQQAWH